MALYWFLFRVRVFCRVLWRKESGHPDATRISWRWAALIARVNASTCRSIREGR